VSDGEHRRVGHQGGRIRCVVGDDHEALRRGVVALLETEPDMEVVDTAADGHEALSITARRAPAVTVVDLRMPCLDGIEIAREVARLGLPTKVVVYTAHDDVAALDEALQAGARGFVLKSRPPQELLRAIRAADSGRTFVDATLAAALLERQAQPARALLSPREAQVLQLLADGHTTDAAAGALFLSPATVRSYVENAIRKLEARNRVQAVAAALRLGLIR
jgi:two-component system, NarL family, nitrate/nitrite response regulator NarL